MGADHADRPEARAFSLRPGMRISRPPMAERYAGSATACTSSSARRSRTISTCERRGSNLRRRFLPGNASPSTASCHIARRPTCRHRDFPADVHQFTVGRRRQSRHRNIRLHTRALTYREWIALEGATGHHVLADRLRPPLQREDPNGVAQLISDSLRHVYDYPGTFLGVALAPHAQRFGLRRGDGLALLRWLLKSRRGPRHGCLDERSAEAAGARQADTSTT